MINIDDCIPLGGDIISYELDGIIGPTESTWSESILESGFDAEHVIGIIRHRIQTDGSGVTTLVGFHGCPLSCAYCLNPQCHINKALSRSITPGSLFYELEKDDIYFRATGGGVTFGGGEPLLRYEFIRKFKSIIDGCEFVDNPAFISDKWRISVETSLNVPFENLKSLIGVVDDYIIDIKDMNPEIYKRYTQKDNAQVIQNLKFLINKGLAESVHVRVPHIPAYNCEADVDASVRMLREIGVRNIEVFNYKVCDSDRLQHNQDSSGDGKRICSVLKKLREDIARTNGIPYESTICNFSGECPGTCPKCEHELKDLSSQILGISVDDFIIEAI